MKYLILLILSVSIYANNHFLNYIVHPSYSEGGVYHQQDEIIVLEFFIEQKKVGLDFLGVEYTFEGDDRDFEENVRPYKNRVTIFINASKKKYSYKISPSTRIAPQFDIVPPSPDNEIKVKFKSGKEFYLVVKAINSALIMDLGPAIDASFTFKKEYGEWSGKYKRDGFPNIEINFWQNDQRTHLASLPALTDDPMIGLSVLREDGEF